MTYTDVSWSEQEPLKYDKLDLMSLNDEATIRLTKRNAKGLLAYTEHSIVPGGGPSRELIVDTTDSSLSAPHGGGGSWPADQSLYLGSAGGIVVSSHSSSVNWGAADMAASPGSLGLPITVTIGKSRYISVNFFTKRLIWVSGKPEPMFTVYIDNQLQNEFIWHGTPYYNVSLAGCVSFSYVYAGLPAGAHSFDIWARSTNGSFTFDTQVRPDASTGGPYDVIQCWIEDLGAISHA